MTNLDSIFKSRDITFPTKVCLVSEKSVVVCIANKQRLGMICRWVGHKQGAVGAIPGAMPRKAAVIARYAFNVNLGRQAL